jgi:hypothetical protein
MGTAHLTTEIPAERAVAAIIPRHEIINALQDPEAKAELTLQVATVSGDATSTIGIEWSREELEQLLRGIETDDVVLTLDADELQWAFDDVEAHGLRERALVFAVAAAGALGSGATIANAMPMSGPEAGGAAATPVASVQAPSAAVADATLSNAHTPGVQIGDAESTAATPSVQASSADSTVSDAASGGGYVAPALSSHETFGVQLPAGTVDGLLAGGALLVIAGATFASRRSGSARPA